ncbi:unnamed protein product [Phytophthora fragariaefolia]|uniref:RxLR effector protein n=1 Tax=Phytophthora fragariaefolia TaxID=1490495 RepID=A0A9W7CXD1_9STRA|nr:unnamed protein product [Phytophthora fragariaefolia]
MRFFFVALTVVATLLACTKSVLAERQLSENAVASNLVDNPTNDVVKRSLRSSKTAYDDKDMPDSLDSLDSLDSFDESEARQGGSQP